MKKTHLTLAIALLMTMAINTHAQDTIGLAISTTDTVPHASSILDITSTSKGLLIPRMTTTQKAGISSPADGLLVYDTDKKGLYLYDGAVAKWKMMGDSLWTKNGNDLYYNSGGNVGINTDTPDFYSIGSGKFLTIRNTVPTEGARVSIVSSTTGGAVVDFGNETIRRGLLGTVDGSHMVFYTNPTNSGTTVSERMRITKDGNIGIGTTSPTEKLELNGDFKLNNGNIQLNSNWLSGDGDDEGIYVSSTGQIGVGTSTPDVWGLGGTDQRLTIHAAGTSAHTRLNLAATGNSAAIIQLGNSSIRRAGIYALAGSDLLFSTNSTDSGTSITEKMRITSSGNIGIGTTSPTEKLELNGDFKLNSGNIQLNSNWLSGDGGDEGIYVSSTGQIGIGTATPDVWGVGGTDQRLTIHAAGTSAHTRLNLAATGNSAAIIQLGNSSIRRAGIYALAGSDLLFSTNSTDSGTSITEKMRITSSGNVGIATTTPSEELDVAGDLAVSDTIFYGTLFQSSDQRLKQNISNYSAGLEKLRRIKPVKYEYNGQARTPGGQRVGIIAQDLQTVVPEAVKKVSREYKEGDVADYTGPKAFVRTQTETTENGDTTQVNIYKAEHLGYDQNVLFYLMLNAIKELDTENQSLKARIEALENQ